MLIEVASSALRAGEGQQSTDLVLADGEIHIEVAIDFRSAQRLLDKEEVDVFFRVCDAVGEHEVLVSHAGKVGTQPRLVVVVGAWEIVVGHKYTGDVAFALSLRHARGLLVAWEEWHLVVVDVFEGGEGFGHDRNLWLTTGSGL